MKQYQFLSSYRPSMSRNDGVLLFFGVVACSGNTCSFLSSIKDDDGVFDKFTEWVRSITFHKVATLMTTDH